jgi:cell division protein FtsN
VAVLPKDLLMKDNIKIDTITQNRKVQQYYIIAGSFIDKKAAQKSKLKFEEIGYSCEILNSKNGRYRLSIYASIIKDSVLKELKRIKQNEQAKDIWVLKE